MSLKRTISPSASPLPAPKRAPPEEEAVESTHYYVLCQIFNYDTAKTHTSIARCYTTANEALNFVRNMVRGWEPHVERYWEEDFEDQDGEKSKLLLRVTTKYSALPEAGGASMQDLYLLCSEISEGEEVTISVQQEKVPIYKPPPPPPIPMEEVYVVVQKDIDTRVEGEGVAVSTLHGAYAERKAANQAARRVLRVVSGELDAVGRIKCRHEESMDEGGLYGGCAYVEEVKRSRVEVVVERLNVR